MRSARVRVGSLSAIGSVSRGSRVPTAVAAFCRRGDENLCEASTFTGWDIDGGYADFCVADERYVYVLPPEISDEHAAPLLCAGIIGYRSLLAAAVPPGGRLGIYGFGGSAHLTAQIALHLGMRVHVLTRGSHNQELARALGVDSVGEAADTPPEPLDGAILFAPAGELVPVALRALDAGGTLAVAGIWLSDIPAVELRGGAVPRAPTAQRHCQHQAGRRGVSATCPAVRRPSNDRRLRHG